MLLKCGKVKMNVETSSHLHTGALVTPNIIFGCGEFMSSSNALENDMPKTGACHNQKVWLPTRDIPLGLPSRKLVPRFVGPYEIDTIISPAPVWLKLPASWRTPPRFHISQFKPDGGGSIWWTGRVMVRRSVPGFHSHLFWIPV